MLDPSTFDESTQLGAGIYAAIFVFLDFLDFMCQVAEEEKGKWAKSQMGKWVARKVRDEREGGTSEHVPGLRDEDLIG